MTSKRGQKMRWLVIVCISGLFLLGLTGISGANVTISIWDEWSAPPGRTATDALYKAFEKAHPDITVSYAHFENTPYEWVLKAAFAGGEPPNIIEANGGADLFQYVRAGKIMDITDLVEKHIDRLTGGFVDFELGGKYWGVPIGGSFGNMLFYNTDILEKYGISRESFHTWSGFMAACEKLKNVGVTPIAFGNKEGWNGNHYYSHFLFALLGKEKFEKLNMRSLIPGWKSELKYTDPAALKAWELYAKLWEKGYFPPGAPVDDYPTAYTYFLAGKAAFFQTGSWFIATARYNAPDFPLEVVWFPTKIEGSPIRKYGVADHTLEFAITTNNTPETYEAARKFIEWRLAAREPFKIWAEIGGRMQPYNEPLAGLKIDPLLKRLMEEAAEIPSQYHSTFMDHIMDFDICNEYTWIASQGILTGDLTPQEAAERLEEAVQNWEKKHPEKETLQSPSLGS